MTKLRTCARVAVLLWTAACAANANEDKASAGEIRPSDVPARDPRAPASNTATQGDNTATQGEAARTTPNGAPSGTANDPQAGSVPTDDAKGSSLRASPTGGLGRSDRKGVGEAERTDPPNRDMAQPRPSGGETGAADVPPR